MLILVAYSLLFNIVYIVVLSKQKCGTPGWTWEDFIITMAGSMYSLRSVLSAFMVVGCLLLSVSASDGEVIDDQPVVRTSTATFRGKRFEIRSKRIPSFERSVDIYSKIPYAEPPVGDLRYARPVAKTIIGDFDATQDPVACAQVRNPFLIFDLPQSEDCLFLDVTVPQPQVYLTLF